MSLKVPLSVQTAGSFPRKSLAPLHCINNDWVGSLYSRIDWLFYIFFSLTLPQHSLSSFLFISHPFFLTFSLQHVFQFSCGSHDSRHSIDFVRSIPIWSPELTLCTSNGASPARKSCPESGSLALDFLLFPPSLSAQHCFSSKTHNYAQGQLQSEKRMHFYSHHFL